MTDSGGQAPKSPPGFPTGPSAKEYFDLVRLKWKLLEVEELFKSCQQQEEVLQRGANMVDELRGPGPVSEAGTQPIMASTSRKSRKAKKRRGQDPEASSSEAQSASGREPPSPCASIINDLAISSENPEKFPGRFPNGNTSVDLATVNLALGQTVLGEGKPRLDAVHGAFPGVFEGLAALAEGRNPQKDFEGIASINAPRLTAMQRQNSQTGLNQQQQPPSPGGVSNATNGVAPAVNGLPTGMLVHAGQQMDFNFIHSKLAELSEQHRANRAQTQQLIASTEQLAKRAASGDAPTNLQEASAEISAARAADARIADLNQKLSSSQALVRVLKNEQKENGKLIGEYEQALEKVVGMLRDFATSQAEEKSAIARSYLDMLQAERDEHLRTRLEKDEYFSRILKLQEDIRTAYRLRCEESVPDIEIIAGLQNEVRGYRNALGMEPEKFEDEFGYPVLKNVTNGAGEP